MFVERPLATPAAVDRALHVASKAYESWRRVPLEQRAALMEFLKAKPPGRLLRSPLAKVDARDGVKFVAADSTWLMLRGSGTEPVLRIYAEGKSDADCEKLLKAGRGLLR